MQSYIIATQRLGLRRWCEADIEPFARMNQDQEVMKYFPKTLSYEETIKLVERINQCFENNNFGLFAVENKSSKEFLGFTGFAIPSFESFFTPCVEIGWRYQPNSWGKGYATEAALACLHYGFNELKLEKIVSFTASINTRSEKLMRRIGMKSLGMFDHPELERSSILCHHVIYEIYKDNFKDSL